ncbi:MAG: hypothetical protein WCB15_27085, partial [Desulfobacterales bacterium]
LFPLFIPSIPTFHYSIIPCGFLTWMAIKNAIFPTICRNSETFNYLDKTIAPAIDQDAGCLILD